MSNQVIKAIHLIRQHWFMLNSLKDSSRYGRVGKCLQLLCMTLLLSFSFFVAVARAEVAVPTLTGHVMDLTNTLTEVQQLQLERELVDLEVQTGAQIVVLMLPTIQPDTPESFTRRVFDTWKIGRKKIDDGVLFLVAKNDRRMRIEVGYGLEGAITDLQSSGIINQDVAPYFKKNDYAGGVAIGVERLISLVKGEALPEPQKSQDAGDGNDSLLWPFLIPFLLFFAAIFPAPIAGVLVGVVVYILSGSIVSALFGLIMGMLWSFLARHVFSAQNIKSASRNRGGHNWPGGFGGGGFGGGGFGGGGFGGGGFGGGGFGGGGGSSGGGGASGGW